jgi:lipopolysaccharide transport system permease protein
MAHAGMAVQIAAIGIVFGIIFKVPLHDYLPFIASSIVLWGFISSVLVEGCLSFIYAENIIKQVWLPMRVHVFRVLWKQIVILGHNVVIVPFAFLAVGHAFTWNSLLFFPGLIVVVLNLAWLASLLGIVSSRYRDMPQVVTSVMAIMYFVTPVMWQPSSIPSDTAHILLGLNPLYHMLQIIRLPLLGQTPTLENWSLAITFALVGWIGLWTVTKRFQDKIADWV